MTNAFDLPTDVVDRLKTEIVRSDTARHPVAVVAASKGPVYVAELRDDPRWQHGLSSLRSGYFTPIAVGLDTVGVLGLFANEPDAFSTAHRQLADAYAREVGRVWSLSERGVGPANAQRDPLPSARADATGHDFDGAQPNAAETLDVDADAPDLTLLSDRERDVVLAMCRGRRLSEIARELGISHHTARNHLKRVFKKLGVHSQVELLVLLGNMRGRASFRAP